ncbi:lysophospholipid acyltransferase 7 [Ceratina calcarata]|uniref:Lysophospholipid acyltransferase 7 n=1 Tax=Ceratina calcarata TaxID=156304 RepID=A0AAJ7S263_9HYME|nr:lysophospholipid acyltransferase 7 [Ceratina calcarata]
MWSDIIYVLLLSFCVFIGFYYRNISDPDVKKWIGTIIGFAITVIVSGSHTYYPLIFTLINAIIITKFSPKLCHLASFYFSFFYLLFVSRLGDYVGLPVVSTHTNLILMIMTLKISGLAFEINAADGRDDAQDDVEGVSSKALKNVGITDVFHYGFSYMGLLTGPYYRYRTYWDHLHRPFYKCVDPWTLTLPKLQAIVVYCVLFLIMNYLYPVNYVLTEEYAEQSFLYRHFYMYPTFAVFRLRMYIGMGLAECACQMAGLGAYPAKSNPLPGMGPKDYMRIEKELPEDLRADECNFNAVYNMDVKRLETCMSVRTAMKAWNGCIQYYFGVYVYKRFPYKSLRTLVTLTLSAIWHGWAPGYFICICQIPLFMLTDDLVTKFYRQNEEATFSNTLWYMLGWYEKTTCMAYLGVPFLLLGFEDCMHYYKQVYFSGHIVALLMYVTVLCCKPYILKKAKKEE